MTAHRHHHHGSSDPHATGDYDDHGHPHRRLRGPSMALGWSLLIILGFGAVEIAVGMLSGSLALVSDGVHMLTDSLALAIAWGAQWLARREAGPGMSFGWGRVEPLAAFANAIFYAGVLVFIVHEAIGRIVDPPAVDPTLALPVAIAGLVVNAVIWRILHGDREQLNTRAALLHVIGDFAGSVIAIVAMLVVRYTGWMLIDPLLSLAISALLLVSTARLLRDSGRVLMNGIPEGLDATKVADALSSIDGVADVHDLHLWSIGDGQPGLAAHLQVRDLARWPRILEETRAMLKNRFGIIHSTLQAEQAGDAPPPGGADPGIGLALRLERELDAQSAAVARALREDIGPQLTALRTLAASVDSRLAGSEPSLSPLITLMLRQADSLIESVRGLVAQVRPDALSCGGLPEALRALAADWRLRRPDGRVELLLDPPDDAAFGLAAAAVETAALQVAVATVEWAFGAGAATGVVLSASRSGDRLLLQIERDGAGPGRTGASGVPSWFAAADARVAALGGESQIEAGEAGGTSVVVRLPWTKASSAPHGGGGAPV